MPVSTFDIGNTFGTVHYSICYVIHKTKDAMICFIPPTRFELVSPAPKAGMIDHYTTGVDNVLDEYTSQISLLKICSIHFSA